MGVIDFFLGIVGFILDAIEFLLAILALLLHLNTALIVISSLFFIISLYALYSNYKHKGEFVATDIFRIILGFIVFYGLYRIFMLVFGNELVANWYLGNYQGNLFAHLLNMLLGILYYVITGACLFVIWTSIKREKTETTTRTKTPEEEDEERAQARIKEYEKTDPKYAEFLRKARKLNRQNIPKKEKRKEKKVIFSGIDGRSLVDYEQSFSVGSITYATSTINPFETIELCQIGFSVYEDNEGRKFRKNIEEDDDGYDQEEEDDDGYDQEEDDNDDEYDLEEDDEDDEDYDE